MQICSPYNEKMVIIGKALYWVPAALLLASGILFLPRKFPSLANLRIYLVGAVLSVALTVLAGISFAPQYRVQWDESELYETSLAMHFQHTALTPSMGLPGQGGRVLPVVYRLGRRPPLFSLLTCVLHSIRGVAADNPLKLNQALLAILLLSAFCFAYSFSQTLSVAVSTPVLLSAVPLLFWQSTSGSMDLLSTLGMLAMAAAAAAFWRAPTGLSFIRLAMLGACACYARYEVVGVFALILIICAIRAWKHRDDRKFVVISIALLPFVLLPLCLLLSNSASTFVEAQGQPLFHPNNFLRQAPQFLKAFFWPALGAYNGILNLASAIILFEVIRRKFRSVFLAFVATTATYSTLIGLAFFDGNPLGFESARLFLLPSVALALAPLLLLKINSNSRAGYLLLLSSLVLFSLNLYAEWKTRILPDSLATQASEGIRDYFAHETPADRAGKLYIFDPPGFLISLGVPAVSPEYFAYREKDLENLRGIYWIRTGAEIESPASAKIMDQIKSHYASREVARLPLQPTNTVVHELMKIK